MNKSLKVALGFALCAPMLLANEGGCEVKSSSDRVQSDQQERILMQATNAVGMPAIVNFQERRMLKQVLEIRDTTISTVTYIVDLGGRLHKVCDSVGYGLPYSTQYTNPQKLESATSQYGVILPQADPNGLFSPPSAEGTWIQCLNPTTKKLNVVYMEPRVIVSPFPLDVP